MKNPLWSSVYDLIQEVDTLLSRAERFGAGGAGAAAAPSADAPPADAPPADAPPADAPPAEAPVAAALPKRGKAGFFKAYVATDDLVEVRAKLRSKLDLLKAQLAEHLTEREVFLVLFPLVVLFDELVQNRFVAGGAGGSWPSLQSELLQDRRRWRGLLQHARRPPPQARHAPLRLRGLLPLPEPRFPRALQRQPDQGQRVQAQDRDEDPAAGDPPGGDSRREPARPHVRCGARPPLRAGHERADPGLCRPPVRGGVHACLTAATSSIRSA